VFLEPGATKTRTPPPTALAPYLQLENYANNWRRLGFTEEDLAGGGSNRLVDANVAWGDEAAIRARIQLFWDAGADHVCIQSIHPSGSRSILDERIFDLLAPGAA
jgi:hypothetical protein